MTRAPTAAKTLASPPRPQRCSSATPTAATTAAVAPAHCGVITTEVRPSSENEKSSTRDSATAYAATTPPTSADATEP
ncbi:MULTISPECIES: hypothetical protein [Rhodococcus]|uniref:hypothetical protein n=1 Tax=Rhodococcus TaxID=1827 RepID=UPI0021756958|nr:MULTISPECIES: hypothetical protein [Rhodococcus]